MKKRDAKVLVLLQVLLLVTGPVFGQSTTSTTNQGTTDFATARKLIKDRMAAESIPSFSVAVARKGEILWEESFGWADRENRVAATKNTAYYLASVTKTITATAIMALHERKQLNIERPINAYLGPARLSSPMWDANKATVRHVATHTAGLTTFVQARFGVPANFSFSQDQIIRRYGIVFWPPGDHFDYSNLGFGILGEVVARTSRKSFGDFLLNEIFRPLGMTDSSLGIPRAAQHEVAKRYSAEFGLQPLAASGTPGASLVYSSTHDLLRFGMFHLKSRLPNQKAVISNATVDQMQNATVEVSAGRGYGLGWWINEDLHGYRSVSGQGGTTDASASLQLIPSEGIVVVALANTGTRLPGDVIDEVLATLLPTYRQRLATDKDQVQTKMATAPPPAMEGNWAGVIKTYRGDVQLTLSISESGEVRAQLGTQPQTQLKNVSFEKEQLLGLMSAKLGMDLGTNEDAGPAPYDLDFELYVRRTVLYGSATTRPHPGMRDFARLPFWVELKKLKTD